MNQSTLSREWTNDLRDGRKHLWFMYLKGPGNWTIQRTLTTQQANSPIVNGQRIWSDIFPKKINKWSTLWAIREKQIKTITRKHHTPPGHSICPQPGGHETEQAMSDAHSLHGPDRTGKACLSWRPVHTSTFCTMDGDTGAHHLLDLLFSSRLLTRWLTERKMIPEACLHCEDSDLPSGMSKCVDQEK